MDGISLQQFLQARQVAQTRMQSSHANTPTQTPGKQTDWQAILEAKRRELGVGSSANPSTTATSQPVARAYQAQSQNLDARDLQSRALQLRQQQAQGLAVRSTGNFLDVRA